MVFMAIWYFPFILCLPIPTPGESSTHLHSLHTCHCLVVFLIRFKIKPRDSLHADFLESCVPNFSSNSCAKSTIRHHSWNCGDVNKFFLYPSRSHRLHLSTKLVQNPGFGRSITNYFSDQIIWTFNISATAVLRTLVFPMTAYALRHFVKAFHHLFY